MDSAIDRKTGQIIDSEQLWHINPVDKNGYVCRGCRALVDPVSYERHNKIRPHFRENRKHPHESWCNIDGEEKLVAKGRKERLTTLDGFPAAYPSKLQLVDERRVVDDNPYTAASGTLTLVQSDATKEANRKLHSRSWTARTIRSICKTYMNFPYDRDLPLTVSNICGNTYNKVFQKLPSSEIVITSSIKIFTAPISWSRAQEINNAIVVELGYGLWAGKNLVTPYRVVIDTSEWGFAKKNSVLKEIEVARREAIEMNKKGRKNVKSWLFFLATQRVDNPTIFTLNDHRLICCLSGVMI